MAPDGPAKSASGGSRPSRAGIRGTSGQAEEESRSSATADDDNAAQASPGHRAAGQWSFRRHSRVKTTFDVAPDFTVPALAQLTGDGGRIDTDVVALSSTYYDTAALDLLRYGLTLRRLDEAAAAWQVEVPAGSDCTELRWPAGDDGRLPAQAAALLDAFLHGAPLTPVVSVDVARTRHRLYDAAGAPLAEVADDEVRANPLGAQVRAKRWREVEVGAETRGLAAAVGAALTAAGAFASPRRSRLTRALHGVGAERAAAVPAYADDALADYISRQCDALVAAHFAIHADAPDSVHQARVASRRLRGTLRTFERYYDAEQAGALADELSWYAAVLGEVRDREVLHARIVAALAELPDDLVVGPVAPHIEHHLAGELAARRADLAHAMAGERYSALLAAVARCSADPPFTARAAEPSSGLKEPVEQTRRILVKRLRQATGQHGAASEVHRVRKIGKRLRYAAEVLPGAKWARLARDVAALQDLLGEFQDAAVAVDLLRRLAADAWNRGEDGFTYGVLVAEERARGERARRKAARWGGGSAE